jgi:hypothetical protein
MTANTVNRPLPFLYARTLENIIPTHPLTHLHSEPTIAAPTCMIAGCPVASSLDSIGRNTGSGSWGKRKGGGVCIVLCAGKNGSE